MANNSQPLDGNRTVLDLNHIYLFKVLGLLISFFLSLTIVIKRRWFWLNSLLAFLPAYLLYRFSNFNPVYHMYDSINLVFLNRLDTAWTCGFISSTVLVIGIMLFFSIYFTKLINDNK